MKHKCPICGKPTDSQTDADFPFCSERCRLLDLGNWASEKYKVSRPMNESMDESESDESQARQRGDDSHPRGSGSGRDDE